MDDFLLRAIVAGAGVAIVGGVLGCFVVWRRMAYFGDSLAHSSLLGAALAAWMEFNLNVGILAVSCCFALGLVWLQERQLLATDTLLGILAHSALAFGVIAIFSLPAQNFNLHNYLFGDILTVTVAELWEIGIGGCVMLALLFANWRNLVLTTISEDLAKGERINTFAMRLLLVFLMMLAVALSVRIVGVLLVTALLIIPAAMARQLTRAPETMAALSAVCGVVMVIVGLGLSFGADLPSGPSIVAVGAALFFMVAIGVSLTRHWRGRD